MPKQRLGRIDWGRTYAGENIRDELRFCSGYCPKCKAKQTLSRSEIEEFNKNSTSIIELKWFFLNLQKWGFFIKNIFKIRVKIELTKPEVEAKKKYENKNDLKNNLTSYLEAS